MLFVLTTTTLLWLLVPFVPALLELRRRTDAAPLPLSDRYEEDLRHAPQRFEAWVRTALAPTLDACRRYGYSMSGQFSDGTPYHVAGHVRDLPAETGATIDGLLATGVACTLPPGLSLREPAYAAADIEGGARSTFTALFGERDVTLGAESTVCQWLHARGTVRTGAGSVLHGSVSAERALVVPSGCRFERLHAPLIRLGDADAPQMPERPDPLGAALLRALPLPRYTPPHPYDASTRRTLVRGDLFIPPGHLVDEDLVVTGHLRIGAGAVVVGSVKVHDALVLEAGVQVAGHLVSGGDLRIGPGCRVRGVVLAERTLVLDAESRLGVPGHPTTVSAAHVYVHGRVDVCGTLWALEHGEVR